MKDNNLKLEFKFIPGLNPNLIGLPERYALALANLIKAALNQDLLKRQNDETSDNEKRERQWEYDSFVKSSTFSVINLEDDKVFQAYITEGTHVEISDIYENKLFNENPIVRIRSNQLVWSQRWNVVKSFSDTFDVDLFIRKISSGLTERNFKIISDIYGLETNREMTIKEVADSNNLTSSRIRQIIEHTKRSALIKTRRVRNDLYFHWFKELWVICENNKIGLDQVLDYMELKFGNKFKLLRTFLPILRNSERYYDFIYRNASYHKYNNFASEKLKGIPIDALPIAIRAINVLKAYGISSAGQLALLTESEMLKIPNLGRRSLSEIQTFLNLYKSSMET